MGTLIIHSHFVIQYLHLIVDSSERSASPFDDLDSEVQEPSRKKARTTFTSEQLRGLESIFSTQRYLSASDRTTVARKLHLTDFQVNTQETVCDIVGEVTVYIYVVCTRIQCTNQNKKHKVQRLPPHRQKERSH